VPVAGLPRIVGRRLMHTILNSTRYKLKQNKNKNKIKIKIKIKIKLLKKKTLLLLIPTSIAIQPSNIYKTINYNFFSSIEHSDSLRTSENFLWSLAPRRRLLEIIDTAYKCRITTAGEVCA
jgi:hypothetical protein